MERLADPPSVKDLLSGAPPETRSISAGALFWRIFFRGGNHPVSWKRFRHFGPTDSRFDHHPADPPARDHPQHAILYLTEQPDAAFGEFFQKTRVINRTLGSPWIVALSLREPITLLDLTRGWTLKVGGGASIASGDRSQARKWSRVFHEAFPAIDGVCYRSSLNSEWMVLALYERARRCMPGNPLLQKRLSDANVDPLVRVAASVCNYDLV